MRSVRQLLIFSILVTLPTLCVASGRVVWDVSHSQLQGFDLNHNYRAIASLLRDNGYSLTELSESLDGTGLWNADIFVVSALSNYETPYSSSEITLVEHFVQAGGGLIILADNNAARPRNLIELTRRFGVLTSRDDRIGNLSRFIQNDLLSEIQEVTFSSGSSLELVGQGGAVALAYDEANRIGIARQELGAGKVIVIGDADLWTNDQLTQSDNADLALTLFTFLNRDARGRIALPENRTIQYLPIDGAYPLNFTIENTGDGPLEYRLTAQDGSPVSIAEPYGIIASRQAVQVEFINLTEGLDPERVYETQIVINHNDPTSIPTQYTIELHLLAVLPTHFTSPPSTGIDHSLLITDITIEEEFARAGLEVAVFTPDGFCAGAGRFLNEALGIAVRGDDPATEAIEGFRRNEGFGFMLYTPWNQRELAVNATLIEGDPRFVTDGFSVFTLDGRGGHELTLELNERWSLVSLNVTPVPLSPQDILTPLLEADLLMMVKDGEGHFWDITRNFNNLGEWNQFGAYQIKVRQPTELTIFGAEVDATQPISLHDRWNSVAYLPVSALPLPEALASLQDHLQVVKRGDGAFYLPRFNWNGIGAMEPGYGYQIRLSGAADLTYPAINERAAANISAVPHSATQNDRSMSLLVIKLDPAVLVTAYYGGLLVGSGSADQTGRIGLPIWGDDPETSELDGAPEGAMIELFINGIPSTPTWLEGDGRMRSLDVAVAEFAGEPYRFPRAFSIKLTPNPFNDRTLLKVANRSSDLQVEIFDTAGRLYLSEKFSETSETGTLDIDLPARQLPSGVLIIRVSSGGRTDVMKAIHLP